MKSFGIPFIGSISEHKTLITSTHIFFILRFVNSCSNILILSMHIQNNAHVISIKATLWAGESNFFNNSSSNLLEVDLGAIDGNFSE